MKENSKFLFQTLIIPVVLAIVGFRIDGTLQEKQRDFDKIKFTDQVLNEAFDSQNADKAFALTKLIPQLVNDKPFADTLIRIITNHYLAEALKAAQVGNDTIYHQISDAAKSNQISSVTDTLKKNPETSKAEEAIILEHRGLEQIQQGQLQEAQTSFAQADEKYPGFHSAHEISNLLKTKNEEIKNDGDSNKAKQEVMQSIRKNYSWKMSFKK